ncbi:MAG TPA: hypothetical protein VK687_06830 [Bryobacteraceae bacterium]|jgi:hypothetical protein|nr:hypothetical protein [Bryobacteraceae bacterium]
MPQGTHPSKSSVRYAEAGSLLAMTPRVMVAMLPFVASAFAQAPRPITFAGEFSNMRYTEEHAYGYTLQLWREGATVFGLFLASEGLAGDTPTGLLDDLKYDPRSGKLSFKAKLTMGVDARLQPSHDLFEFDGTLGKAAVSGVLKRAAVSERINLRKLEPNAALPQPRTYDEWKRQTDEIIRRRGPKW